MTQKNKPPSRPDKTESPDAHPASGLLFERKERERKEKEILFDCFVPDNEKYIRLPALMDEETVRGLRTFCERRRFVCARQTRLRLPGTVLERYFRRRWAPSLFTRESIAESTVEEMENLCPNGEYFINRKGEKEGNRLTGNKICAMMAELELWREIP
ncbi:MAG: hypothetical protein ACI3U8_00110 [Candidatus Onthomonas sp.]